MRFLVCLVDKTSFYLPDEEGKKAMVSWSLGDNIVCRKGAFAHYLISSIRAVERGSELDANAQEMEELEERNNKILKGELILKIDTSDTRLEEAARKMLAAAKDFSSNTLPSKTSHTPQSPSHR